MMFSVLPPAGNRVHYSLTGGELPNYPGYSPIALDSGTAALALALMMARALQPEVQQPEVIVPAYCCPDLVAAAVFAGVRPMIVDIGMEGDPGYLLPALKRAISANTLAVIAVNFLGVCERLGEIRAMLPRQVLLIEDDAQWHPEPGLSPTTSGDLVVTSFGRGKPASILGGGLLLVKQGLAAIAGKPDSVLAELVNKWVSDAPPSGDAANVGTISGREFVREWVKIFLYNFLRQPFLYYWITKLPMLNLGETKYHPVIGIEKMTPVKQQLLSANIDAYLNRQRPIEHCYDEINFERWGMVSIARLCADRRRRLLRYPVMCKSREQRDRVLNELIAQGLGATSLYSQPLDTITGVHDKVTLFAGHANADDFAGRLITLPVHDLVAKSHVSAIRAVLSAVA